MDEQIVAQVRRMKLDSPTVLREKEVSIRLWNYRTTFRDYVHLDWETENRRIVYGRATR